MTHAYWGAEASDSEIQDALEQNGLEYRKESEESVIARTAAKLADGGIVGWYQGRFEWGPRALGNRSILADPRKPEMKDLVNNKIKFREPFRPFAPAVLMESCHKYFDLPEPEAHMPARFGTMNSACPPGPSTR